MLTQISSCNLTNKDPIEAQLSQLEGLMTAHLLPAIIAEITTSLKDTLASANFNTGWGGSFQDGLLVLMNFMYKQPKLPDLKAEVSEKVRIFLAGGNCGDLFIPDAADPVKLKERITGFAKLVQEITSSIASPEIYIGNANVGRRTTLLKSYLKVFIGIKDMSSLKSFMANQHNFDGKYNIIAQMGLDEWHK